MNSTRIDTGLLRRALRGEFPGREVWRSASFQHVLEQYPAAVYLALAATGAPLAANSAFLKLTEWTRAELLDQTVFENLLPAEILAQLRLMNPGSTRNLPAVPLRTRSGRMVAADLKLSAVHDERLGERLVLVQAASTQERLLREQEEAQVAQAQAKLEQLARLQDVATEASVPAAVQLAREAAAADLAALYLVTATPPGLTLRHAEADAAKLPSTLGPSELQWMTKPLAWNNSQRPEALLGQVARSQGWGYVFSAPVGDSPNIEGALVVAFRSGNPPPAATAHRLAGAARQVHRLLQQIQRQQKLADAQRLAIRLSSQMAALYAQIEEGIVILNGEGAIDEINPAAAQMLGYRSEDVSGLPYTDILVADAHVTDAILVCLEETTGMLVRGNLYRRGGQAFPAAIRIQPLPDYGCVITLHDDSEEQASRMRREHLDNLAYVGQSTQAFAHEVRGPLNNIYLGMQYLQSRLKDADEAVREAINKILVDSNRLSVLMNEMLAWAKPVDPRFELIDLASLLQRLLSRWHNKIQQRNVHLRFVADENCPTVMADQILLERVFVNLIDNALQAMPAGGDLSVRLQFTPANPPAQVASVLVHIGDSGPGIPEEIRRQIFDPYFTTRPNGTGLGLAICRRLVTVNRGAISVESYPGTGTIFTVTLPAYQAADLPPTGGASA